MNTEDIKIEEESSKRAWIELTCIWGCLVVLVASIYVAALQWNRSEYRFCVRKYTADVIKTQRENTISPFQRCYDPSFLD